MTYEHDFDPHPPHRQHHHHHHDHSLPEVKTVGYRTAVRIAIAVIILFVFADIVLFAMSLPAAR